MSTRENIRLIARAPFGLRLRIFSILSVRKPTGWKRTQDIAPK